MTMLPIAITARCEDLRAHKYAPWQLVYDTVGEIVSRRHRYGEPPEWEVRHIRVDQPLNMLDGVTVPLDQRGDRASWEQAHRERRRRVQKIADTIIDGNGSIGVDLQLQPGDNTDFDLEREVLDELWRRWREETSDGFLLRALRSRP